MSVLVFAVPYTPPPPPPQIWFPYDSTWTSPDGEVWPLTDHDGGIALIGAVLGLHLPPVDRYTSESPARDGSRFRGTRARSRPVEWPVLIFGDGSQEWADRDQAFWRSLDTDRPGTWTVTTPFGQKRTLRLRLTSDGDHAFELDPFLAGWSLYQIALVADDPYWAGEPVSQSWGTLETVEFFDADGSPAFHISSSATTDGATMTNPGEKPAWVRWTFTATDAPMTVTATVDGGAITTPEIPAGKTLVVETDPAKGTAWLGHISDGEFVPETKVSGQINPWKPKKIPAGTAVPLGINITGQGTVQAEITPLFRRMI